MLRKYTSMKRKIISKMQYHLCQEIINLHRFYKLTYVISYEQFNIILINSSQISEIYVTYVMKYHLEIIPFNNSLLLIIIHVHRMPQ